MATRKTTNDRALPDARLRPDQIQPALQRLRALGEEVAAFDASKLTKRHGPEQSALSARIANEIAAIFGSGTAQAKRFANAQKLDYTPIQLLIAGVAPVHEIPQDVENAKRKSLEILGEAIAWVERQAAARS